MSRSDDFELRFTSRKITAWGGLALMRRMLQSIQFSDAARQWDLPQPGSNRGYEPVQIIEQHQGAGHAVDIAAAHVSLPA